MSRRTSLTAIWRAVSVCHMLWALHLNKQLERQIADENQPQAVKSQLKGEVDALQRLAEERSAYTALLLSSEQLARRALAQLAPKTELIGFTQKVMSWYGRFNGIWDIEIWVIDNNPVTVREIVVALIVLIAGIAITKILLRLLAKKIFAITNIKQTTAATIQKIISYLTYLLVALLAMRIVNTPWLRLHFWVVPSPSD
jgi:hypothetical protein